MRLFTAILLNENVINKISNRQSKLLRLCTGKPVPPQNMHITLNFIGETSRTDDIISAMKKTDYPKFEYNIQGLGRFSQNSGDILWTGIADKSRIEKLHRQLTKGLLSLGFNFEFRPFKPHITLARKVKINNNNYYTAKKIFCTEITAYAEKISLMKSEHQNNHMIYTEIYSKNLV